MSGLDDETDLAEEPQRPSQLVIGKVVAHLATLPRRPYQAAAPQAREMVGDVRPTLVHLVGELGRVRRTVEQSEKDAATYTVGHRRTDTPKRVEPSIEQDADSHGPSIVQQLM